LPSTRKHISSCHITISISNVYGHVSHVYGHVSHVYGHVSHDTGMYHMYTGMHHMYTRQGTLIIHTYTFVTGSMVMECYISKMLASTKEIGSLGSLYRASIHLLMDWSTKK